MYIRLCIYTHLHIYDYVKLKVVFAGSAMNLAEFEVKMRKRERTRISDVDRTDSFSETGKESDTTSFDI